MTFANNEDVLSFRHHMYEKRGGKEVVLNEVGPRFEMQLYQLRLGTLDQVCIIPIWRCVHRLLSPLVSWRSVRFVIVKDSVNDVHCALVFQRYV